MNVFNNIFNVAKEVTTAAGKKTDSYVQISKLKLSCVQINNEIKSKYEVLGNKVYDMMKSGEEDTSLIVEMVTDIDNSFKRLTEASVRIEELKNNIVCSSCGAPNKPDSLFCNKCGSKLVIVEKNSNYVSVELDEESDEKKVESEKEILPVKEESNDDFSEEILPDEIIDPEDDETII